MADFKLDVVALAKASRDYDTHQQSVYSTLSQMTSEIDAAQAVLKGAAVNAFSSCKAEWDEGASGLHQVLDKTGAALGTSATNAATNETSNAQGFRSGVTADAGSAYTAAAGSRVTAGAVLTSELTNITFKAGSVQQIHEHLTTGQTKLKADLDQIDAIAKATSSYWEAGSQSNYNSFHTKTWDSYTKIDDAIRKMSTNVDTWQSSSTSTETTNAGMWNG